MLHAIEIPSAYSPHAQVSLYCGDCKDFLPTIPPESVQLIVTSPPYNIGKKYEKKRHIEDYVAEQAEVIAQCVRLLRFGGSICWQVGNHVSDGEIIPLDILLYPIFKSHGLHLRNRIIWHFEHGLHCARRFSGRYETIIWFTKGEDYVFDLDAVRVPQKYPGKKFFKGPKVGQYSCNPLGKNPGDLWILPNVKHNHPEKTEHPCQFPVELIERLVLSMTNPGDLVLDPFMGVGTTAVAALLHKRRATGAETEPRYVEIAKERIQLAAAGLLKYRPMFTPVYAPPVNTTLTRNPFASTPKRNPRSRQSDQAVRDLPDQQAGTRPLALQHAPADRRAHPPSARHRPFARVLP